jgi:hypothetical protein
MTDYYWTGDIDSLASKPDNWSLTSGGSSQGSSWSSAPSPTDNFFFNSRKNIACIWESSVVSMATVGSIQQSLTEPYTAQLTVDIAVQLQGLILNGPITSPFTMTFTGTPSASLNDSAGKKRFILNGALAKHSAGSNLTYRLSPGLAGVCLDSGPYNNVISDTNPLTLSYNVPTSITHANSDNETIHIKGTYASISTGGFNRISPANAAEDTKVSIKFDNISFSYAAPVLDFIMATAHFRGIELPVTGTTTYGSSAGFTAKHYGVVLFAATNGELSTISNGVQLDVYSLEIKAGARLRVNSNAAFPAIIKSQTEPKIAGVWSFESLSSHTFSSPRSNPVTSVANGGTGLADVPPNNLLMGSSNGMAPLTKITPGINGQVLTLTGGVPGWAASGGGGGGMTSFTVAGTSGSNQTITDGNTLTIAAGTGITTTGSATDTVTIASTITQYTDADAIAAVEGEADLALSGEIQLTANPAQPALGTVALGQGVASANTLGIRTNYGSLNIGMQNATYCHFRTDADYFYFARPLQFDGGDGVYAYNGDFWVRTDAGNNGTPIERLTILGGTSVTTGGETRIGIANTTPTNSLHVKTAETLGDGAYAARFQMAEGNVGTTRYGGIHLDNDNNAPIDGADWSAQRWQISQRDSDHLDIAYGTPINTNVSATDTDLRITNTGNVGIGLGNTDPSTKLHVSGTIRQTASTNAVLVSNANGDIVSASNLADVPYVPIGQGGLEPYNAANPGNWLGPPPSTLEQAIQRIAQQLALLGGPIP